MRWPQKGSQQMPRRGHGDGRRPGSGHGMAEFEAEAEGVFDLRRGDSGDAARDQRNWLQIMYRDALQHDVKLKDWRSSFSPHMVVMCGSCELCER